jgi:hypothetical protein
LKDEREREKERERERDYPIVVAIGPERRPQPPKRNRRI